MMDIKKSQLRLKVFYNEKLNAYLFFDYKTGLAYTFPRGKMKYNHFTLQKAYQKPNGKDTTIDKDNIDSYASKTDYELAYTLFMNVGDVYDVIDNQIVDSLDFIDDMRLLIRNADIYMSNGDMNIMALCQKIKLLFG